MLDVRLVTTSLAMLVALMAVALAEPVRDPAPSAVQSTSEGRPIRVILAAPWEPANRQSEPAKSTK